MNSTSSKDQDQDQAQDQDKVQKGEIASSLVFFLSSWLHYWLFPRPPRFRVIVACLLLFKSRVFKG